MIAPVTNDIAELRHPKGSARPPYRLPLHGLASLRILIVLMIGVGYASTMGVGTEAAEWGRLWGYDPSWYGIQLLFILSGFLAATSLGSGKTSLEFASSRLKSLWPALIAATMVSVLIIYPVMCAPDAAVRMGALDLAKYFFKTILLIDPGSQMPGLMDNAKYMCLLQGAIWTLRWGLILHIGFLIGWKSKILQHPKLTFAVCIAAIAGHVGIVDAAAKSDALSETFNPISPMIRLGYAYLIGVTLFHWQGHLRLHKRRIILSSSAIAALTTLHYAVLPWSSVQEVLGLSVFLTLCLGFLHSAPTAFEKCPRLAPVLYVSIWPAAQIIVALQPALSTFAVILASLALAGLGAGALFLLLRQARIQSASL